MSPRPSRWLSGTGGSTTTPPTPEQAAALLNLAFAQDEEFGLFCWTAFTAGGRRGELLGLREDRIDFEAGTRRARLAGITANPDGS